MTLSDPTERTGGASLAIAGGGALAPKAAVRFDREGRLFPWLLGAMLLHLALALWGYDEVLQSTGHSAPQAINLVLTMAAAPSQPAAPPEPVTPPVEPEQQRVPEPVAEPPPPKPVPVAEAPVVPMPIVEDALLPAVSAAAPTAESSPLARELIEPPPLLERVEEMDTVEETVQAAASVAAAPTPTEANEASDTAAAEVRYRDLVRAQVEREKVYPAMARRRGLEDRVWIEFDVNADGDLGDVRILEKANRVLVRATQAAVAAAAPFPPPPAGHATLRIPVDYSLSR